MRAVVYKKAYEIEVGDIDKPRIEDPTDVIIKITTSGICGSDLHMYEGHTEAKAGMVFGHESLGVVEEIGEAVKLLKRGDRVVVPFNVACGHCFNCVRGFSNACLTMNDKMAGAAYGYVNMGPYKGAQAEYLRVPYGDWACLKLPGEPGDEYEDDFVLLSDVFPTAFHATEMAMVKPGKTVAIFGAGPIGLLSIMSSRLKGAAEIYAVDKSQSRLDKAQELGAVPISFEDGDPVEQIKKIRREKMLASLRPGEEKMDGVDCGIDAVGYQAFSREIPLEYDPGQVISDLVRITNPTGHLGIIGVYLNKDPLGEDSFQQQGKIIIPWGDLWVKGISLETGQAPVKIYQYFLRDLIINGLAKPSLIVTDTYEINEAEKAYKEFDQRDEVIKPLFKFI